MNEHRISLDLSKEPAVPPVLYLGQGDANGTTVIAAIYDQGSVPDLAGATPRLCMAVREAYYEVDGTLSGNVATFHVDETYAASKSGKTDRAYVEIRNGSTVASTNRFIVIVLPSAEDGADPSQAYSNGINEAIERANDAAEAAEGVVLQAVPLMSPTIRGGAQLGSGLNVDANGALNAEVTQASMNTALQSLQNAILQAQTLLNAIGTVPVANGGTGATTAAGALTSLGAASQSDLDEAEQAIADNAADIATLQDSVVPEKVTITKSYPSGITGNIYCYRIGALAIVQFDGFKCSSTTWKNSIVSGFPQPSASKWFTLNSDLHGPVKMYVNPAGALNVRCTQDGGSEHLVDTIIVYPII